MTLWKLEDTDKYQRDLKWYEKKRPDELRGVVTNLATYFNTLSRLDNPMMVTGGFIHDKYPNGIKSIDQRGVIKGKKLQETRLYVYPDQASRTLYLITIGDKQTQKENIKIAVDFVNGLKG